MNALPPSGRSLLHALLIATISTGSVVGAPASLCLAAGRAAQTNTTEGDSLKAQGDAAMDALQYETAIALYQQAWERTEWPAVLYNLARANEALGRYPEALDHLERFVKQATPELQAKIPQLDALMRDLQSRITTVTVDCPVAGARIVVRGTIVGQTPLTSPLRLAAGIADIRVEADEYLPFEQQVQLPGGASFNVQATLKPKDTTAFLTIRTTPVGTVSVDGKALGRSPVEARLKPGSHRLLVTADGYLDHSTTLVAKPGMRRTVELKLQAEPPLTSNWWFWAGSALLVGAAVGTTAALLTDAPADSGNFSPGQIRAPLIGHWP
jgi:tetratricopeptide (TPR) repeat protein